MNHCYCSLLFLMVLTAVVLAEELGSAIDEDSEESAPGKSSEYDANNTQTAKAELTEESRGPLGQGFRVHKMHLLTKQLQATGMKIYENLPYDECVLPGKEGAMVKDHNVITNTETFYNTISTATNIGGSIKGEYTFGATVSAVTNNLASGKTDISGMSLNLKSQGLNPTLKKYCIENQPLDEAFVKDFKLLETNIDNSWKKGSWYMYENFLQKYGSHIVDSVVSGSSVYQYVFAESTEKVSQHNFTVKACLSLVGPTEAGKLNLSACSGVSMEDASTAASLEMVQKLVVRGATTESRSSMLKGELTHEKIDKFLQEGVTHPSPISYTFYPIWQILKTRYIGTKFFVKAANLEQFYKGYLSFGCPYKETTNKKPMQKFELGATSQPKYPIFVCNLAPKGCNVDDDCHGHGNLPFYCTCSGESCIQYKDEKLRSGQTKKVAFASKAKWLFWQGCSFSVSKQCSCSTPGTVWTVSWSGETAKRRDQARSSIKPR